MLMQYNIIQYTNIKIMQYSIIQYGYQTHPYRTFYMCNNICPCFFVLMSIFSYRQKKKQVGNNKDRENGPPNEDHGT